METMFWTFPHVSGKWKLEDTNTLRCGDRLYSVTRWEGNNPVVNFIASQLGDAVTYIGTRWQEGLAVQQGESTAPDVAGAKKFDSDKPMMDLLFDGAPNAVLQVGAVLTYGFKKYGGKHGWKSLPDAIARYEAAMIRHQLAAASGEVNDPESGLPHAAHIACNALFLAELKQEKK